jgi:hypothetical protein
VFYQAVALGLPKEESASRLIQRRLLKLRREGRIPYPWIVDESREVHGHDAYGGLNDLAADVANLYRRDYWRNADCWVQVWIEKRGLAGVIQPIVCDKWGLNLYICAGQPSESHLYRGGSDIMAYGKETHAYVLSDFDPGGNSIFNSLAHGSKNAPGGLRRFTGGVPVHVHQLALSAEQAKAWNLPTRPVKKTDKRAPKFMALNGDVSVELDAIPPNDLRELVDNAIAQHMDARTLETFKTIERQERLIVEDAVSKAQVVSNDEKYRSARAHMIEGEKWEKSGLGRLYAACGEPLLAIREFGYRFPDDPEPDPFFAAFNDWLESDAGKIFINWARSQDPASWSDADFLEGHHFYAAITYGWKGGHGGLPKWLVSSNWEWGDENDDHSQEDD